ncbi:MAG TPA: PAS domain-containing protein [Polyangiales bacterium]|nr:PAS domain-containing protein [Polyangiales bacterium]
MVALGVVRDAVLICDRRGNVVFTNPAFDKLSAYRDASLIGKPVVEVLEPPTAAREILDVLRHEPQWQGELGIRQRTGRVIPVDLTVAPAIEIEPHASHFVLVARRAESSTTSPSALLETIGHLAAEVAHDFNNQISVVLNYTFILLRQLGNESPLKQHVPQMQEAAWHASQVAQELLAFGGPRLTEPEPLDLNAVLERLQDLFRHTLREPVLLETRPSPVLWQTRARLPHIEWMLLELALHARRALGGVERWLVETGNEETDEDGQAKHRSVVLYARAWPARDKTEATFNSALGGRGLPEDPRAMPGVELALTHCGGTLTCTRETDGGISYCLRLPAEPREHAR